MEKGGENEGLFSKVIKMLRVTHQWSPLYQALVHAVSALHVSAEQWLALPLLVRNWRLPGLCPAQS